MISIFPCSFRATRGFAAPIAVLDEFAFFKNEGVNIDKEVLDSIRPAQAQFPKSKLIKISSPYSKTGELYRDFATRHQRPDLLCFRATSKQMNPSLSQKFLDTERERDPEYFEREFEAQFSDSISNAFTREAVESCIVRGRFELPYDSKQRYFAAVDPSGGGADEFTLSICHAEGKTVVQDVIRGWKAKQPQSVVAEAAAILKAYYVSEVVGDRYSGSWCATAFQGHDTVYRFSDLTASEAFLELLPQVNQGNIELLDDKVQTSQLLALERRSGRTGRDTLGHPMGGHDDRANSLALASAKVAEQFKKPLEWGPVDWQVRELEERKRERMLRQFVF